MSYQKPKYEIEIWNRGITKVGEIARYCQSIDLSLVRNGVDTIDFNIDLETFESFCKRIGEDPRNVIKPLVTDIKVKRNGQYVLGGIVIENGANFNQNEAKMLVKCDGYLNLLADRYVTASYAGIEATTIAWGLISTTQSQTNGSVGITQGSMFATGKLRDRNYKDQNVKDGLVNLTQLVDGNFDFCFKYDRTFETYAKLGNDRPDVVINYPASRIGIGASSMNIPQSGAAVFNRIIGKGSGFGDEALTYTANNTASQVNYYLKEKITTYNDISVLQTLTDNVEGELLLHKDILSLPHVTVDGSQFDLNNIGVGDRVVIQQSKYKSYPMSGYFRIEQIDVKLDENMAEDITLTVDNYGL